MTEIEEVPRGNVSLTIKRRPGRPIICSLVVLCCLPALLLSAPPTVVLLPPQELNGAAKTAGFGKKLRQSVYLQLAARKAIALVPEEAVNEALRKLRWTWDAEGLLARTRQLALECKAKYILMGYCSSYGSLADPAKYIDYRLHSADGRVISAVHDHADRVREPSMTISSAASEQLERLGAGIAEAIRNAEGPRKKTANKRFVMRDFQEPGEDVYGQAVARMVASAVSLQAGWIEEIDTAKIPDYYLSGEVVSNTEGKSRIKVKCDNSSTKSVQTIELEFASDTDLRVVTMNLGNRFRHGNERILWQSERAFLPKLHTTPVFSSKGFLIAAPGPTLLMLDAFNGKAVWNYKFPISAKTIGETLHTPLILEERIYVRGANGPTLVSLDLQGKYLGRTVLSGRTPSALDRSMIATESRVVQSVGNHQLLCLALDDDKLVESWKLPERSEFYLSGFSGKQLIAGTKNGKVLNVDLVTGKVLSEHQLDDRLHCAPFLNAGFVFCGTESGTLHCFRIDGKVVWSGSVPGRVTAICSSSERAYFATDVGKLVCLDTASGKILWSKDVSSAITGITALESCVIATTMQGAARYASEDGSTGWAVTLPGPVRGAPNVVSMESILSNREEAPPDNFDRYKRIVTVSSADGYVYAIGDELP